MGEWEGPVDEWEGPVGEWEEPVTEGEGPVGRCLRYMGGDHWELVVLCQNGRRLWRKLEIVSFPHFPLNSPIPPCPPPHLPSFFLSFFPSLFIPLSALQRLGLPVHLPVGKLHLHPVQQRGAVPAEPLQPADLQHPGLPVVRQLRHRAGPVHPGRGLRLVLLGLQQAVRHPHVPRHPVFHTLPPVSPPPPPAPPPGPARLRRRAWAA